MLNNPFYYNRTIRKVVVAFGTLFNDIQVQRFVNNTPKEIFKVPLSYGSKEKYMTRLAADPNLTKSVATVVPRISFELTGMSYDSSRKQITTLKNFSANTSTSLNRQYVPVPYDFNFSMSIYVRNTEDGTQILEQILPFFTPDFTVTVDFISTMDQKYDLPIILNSVNTLTDYEGDMMSTRLITWDLEFTAKGYVWPILKTGKVIRQANTNIYLQANNTTYNLVRSFITTPNPIDAEPDDEFGFTEQTGEELTYTYLVDSNGNYLVTETGLKIREE